MSSFRKSFTIKRKTPGQYVDGRWQEGSVSSFTIQASVQPVSGKETEFLPEGRRTSQAIKIYTDIELKTTRGANPDILEAFGNEFEIETVEPWQSDVINHFKAIGIKI